MTETWNVFTAADLFLGLLGAVGFMAMVVVIATAGKKVNTRETVLREAARAKAAVAAEEEE